MSDFSAWDYYFFGKPSITELSGNRVMLTGKCRWCFGNGRVYVRGDYERCNSCDSICGQLRIIVNNK